MQLQFSENPGRETRRLISSVGMCLHCHCGIFRYLGDMIRVLSSAVALLLFAVAPTAPAQTNAPAADSDSLTNRAASLELSEQMRAQCIAGRRSICGKDSADFSRRHPGRMQLHELGARDADKILARAGQCSRQPRGKSCREPRAGRACIGTVFLTDLPRGKPHQYDYVIIAGYPTGEFTYTSVGTIQKTVRRFSANLDKAVKVNMEAAEKSGAK